MQSVPRPPASVPLGGSLRASRAAQLARPAGPLAAVDLADGRALTAELRGSLWVVVADGEVTLELPAIPAPAHAAPGGAERAPRRRRLGTVVALAAALGAAAVALAAGLSGAPAPAVAAPTVQPVPRAPLPAASPVPPRGGRAVALPRARAVLPPAPQAVVAPPPVTPPPAAPPPAVPAPPPLPELPPAPAL